MKNRYQVSDFFTTTINSQVIFTPALAGITTIPVAAQPSIADGKVFHIIIKPTDAVNRMVLRCFMDAGVLKCNNYDISTNKTYDSETQLAIFDVASLFNAVYQQTEDFGFCEKLNIWGLSIKISGWKLMNMSAIDDNIADTIITVPNASTTYIYFDSNTKLFTQSATEPTNYFVCAKVVSAWWAITSVEDYRPFNINLGTVPPNLTAAEIAALTNVVDGTIVFNKDTWLPQYYSGWAWYEFPASGTATPRMTTVIEGKWRKATTAEFVAGTDVWADSAPLIPNPSDIKSQIYNKTDINQILIDATNTYPLHTSTYTAWTSITAGQHCALSTYGWVNLTDFANIIKTVNASVTTNNVAAIFWQCLILEVWWPNVTTVKVKATITTGWPTNVTATWTSTAYICQMTWNYGTTWNFGTVLYTSDSPVFSKQNGTQTWDITYTFNANIPAWTYALKISWILNTTTNYGSNTAQLDMLWDNTSPAYAGNFINESTPTAGTNMYMVLASTATMAVLSNATNANTSTRLWVATESKTIGQSIILQDQWPITQTWATVNREMWYLSNTPWTIATTPGTQIRMIWQWVGTNSVQMWRDKYLAPITIPNNWEVQYTSIAGLISWYVEDSAWASWGTSVSIEVSSDNVTYNTVLYTTLNLSRTCAVQYEIQARKYFKITCSAYQTKVNPLATFRPIQ
jgi:hypothetical protein